MRELENLLTTVSRVRLQCVEAGVTAVLTLRCATGEVAVTHLLEETVVATEAAKVAVVVPLEEEARGPALSATKKVTWPVNARMVVELVAMASVGAVAIATSVISLGTSLVTAPIRTLDPLVVPWSATSVAKKVTWQESAPVPVMAMTVAEVVAVAVAEETGPASSATRRATWPENAQPAVVTVTLTSASEEILTMVASHVAAAAVVLMTVVTHEGQTLVLQTKTMPGARVAMTTLAAVPGATTTTAKEELREDPREVGEKDETTKQLRKPRLSFKETFDLN